MSIQIALDCIEPHCRPLASRAPGKTLIVPRFFMSTEGRRCHKAFEVWERLGYPALDTLGQTGSLCDQLLRLVGPAEPSIGPAEQEKRFAVTSPQLQRAGQIFLRSLIIVSGIAQ